MSASNPEQLFELVKWFNEFSDQVSTLYTKLSHVLKKELKFKEARRYAQYFAALPWISDIFHMGLVREGDGYSLDVMLVFKRDQFTHRVYRKVPSLVIARVENGNGI